MKNNTNLSTLTGVRLFQGLVAIGIVGTLVLGFVFSGSPQEERQRRFDQQRSERLNQLVYLLDSYAQRHGGLPPSLTELKEEGSIPLDPVTNAPFEYTRTSSMQYTLCGTFALPTDPSPYPVYSPSSDTNFWQHPAGRICYPHSVPVPTTVTPQPSPKPL